MQPVPRAFPSFIILFAACLAALTARADTSTSLGDRSGEGSTPFTGLAQAPEANLFTGALTTAIPIEVPSGRRSMTPQLALQYTSSGGPGPFGFGWDVPIGRIERSTTWGVPRCTGSHTDDFVLVLPTGASELVRESANSNYYRPAVEQAWVRAEKFAAQNYWVVTDRSGLKYTFGNVDAARVGNSTPLTFLNQAMDGSCQLTIEWALTRIEDPNGNVIDVSWAKIFNVLYPVTVRYGASSLPGGPGHTYTIRFLPEWRPPEDRMVSHRTGAAARLLWRIYAIDVETDVPTPGTLVRSYTLQYADDAPGATPDGYQSMLSAVTSSGRPTQHLIYTPSVTAHSFSVTSFATPPGAYGALRVSNASLEVSQTILDMNGDGVLDLVRSDDPPVSTWAVYFGAVDSNGSFAFSTAATPWQAPGNWLHLRNIWTSGGSCSGSDWKCTASDTFDITGDGIPDTSTRRTPAPGRSTRGRGIPQWGFAAGVRLAGAQPPCSSVAATAGQLSGRRRHQRRRTSRSRGQWSTGPGGAVPMGCLPQHGRRLLGDASADVPGAGELARRSLGGRDSATSWSTSTPTDCPTSSAPVGLPCGRRSALPTLGDSGSRPVLEVYFNTGQGFAAATLIPVPRSAACRPRDRRTTKRGGAGSVRRQRRRVAGLGLSAPELSDRRP
jgi:hypothetical protein